MSEEMRPKLPVHIRKNAEVDNEIVNLRRSFAEEIEWKSDGDEFTIEFPITPFAEQTFVVPAGGSVSSGPARPDAPITRYYYNVTNVALAMSADPGVDIKK
ncbi:MAG: hypothetical protein WBQ64_21250 [Terriglobales bacterium]